MVATFSLCHVCSAVRSGSSGEGSNSSDSDSSDGSGYESGGTTASASTAASRRSKEKGKKDKKSKKKPELSSRVAADLRQRQAAYEDLLRRSVKDVSVKPGDYLVQVHIIQVS